MTAKRSRWVKAAIARPLALRNTRSELAPRGEVGGESDEVMRYERSFSPGWFSTSLAYASVSHRHASLVSENPVLKG
jgi:hypothetical protein